MEATDLVENGAENGVENNKVNEELQQNPKEWSGVWAFYNKISKDEDGVIIAACKGCLKKFKCGGKRYGTSTILRHRDRCKSTKFHDVGQMIVDQNGKLRSRKIDQKVSRELLAAAIVKHDLSFSFVEYAGIRAWMKYLNPDVSCISRNTLVSDMRKTYVKEKEKLKYTLANIQNRVCLTSDLWTACTSEGYICLTAHFVDSNWKLVSKILNFAHMPPPHTGVEIAAKIYGFLKDWGVEKKVFSLTLDNASNNDNMQDILKEQLSLVDDLLCDGEFFHIRCCAHVLNIIVHAGLKVVVAALSKIRNSVKYVKGSESRMKKFAECVEEVGININVGLRLDVATRWNSTYMMLDSAIKYKKAFSCLLLKDKNYSLCPSNEEWIRAEKICDFLEPFYETTNLISGSSYPTANLYFMQVWKIEILLKDNLLSEDELVRDMCVKMKEKFDKYWAEYSVVLAFGAVLDPRIKLSMLEYFYGKVENDPIKCKAKLKLVKTKLYKLFEQYSNVNGSGLAQESQPESSNIAALARTSKEALKNKSKGKRIFDEIKEFESQTISSAGKSQLDIYLEEPKLEFSYYEDLDVLSYWRDHKHRFPILALMACDVLAIPITTVASESSFSIGGRVLTKYRSSTLSGNIEAQICSRNWLHGFSDGDEEGAYLKLTMAPQTSTATEGADEEVEQRDNVEDFDDKMIDEI